MSLNDSAIQDIVEPEATKETAVDDLEERMKVKVEVEIDTSDLPDAPEEPDMPEDMASTPNDVIDESDRKASLEVLHRAIDLDARAVDEKTRTVNIAVS